jgi:AcrR family transcriptional regulator
MTEATPPSAPTSAARERILLTAHDLFYQGGIRATGIDRVIAESGVAKMTFYRHFPSKNDLILAFLAHRHTLWLTWFDDALTRHGNTPQALLPTLEEWFTQPSFRGCAFLNSVGELGSTLPQVRELTRSHKTDMTRRIAQLLPATESGHQDALALSMAVDGAIVRAQFDDTPQSALAAMQRMLDALINQNT